MEIYNLFSKARVLLPAALMFVSLNSFSQVKQESAEKADQKLIISKYIVQT